MAWLPSSSAVAWPHACRLALIAIVLIGTWLAQCLPLLLLGMANVWRIGRGHETWHLPEWLVPPRLLLMVTSLTILPAANAGGQLLGAAPHGGLWFYVAGGAALGFALLYMLLLVLALAVVSRQAWALGLVYGTYGVLRDPSREPIQHTLPAAAVAEGDEDADDARLLHAAPAAGSGSGFAMQGV